MLTGPSLGEAVDEAIRLKGVSKMEVARHFGIKGPSIYDWINHGRVSKRHLTELFEYFSDVVGPEHWGTSPSDVVSQSVGLDGETVRAAIILAKKSFKLAHDEDLLIERDPELFSQALRAALAKRQKMGVKGDIGSRSGDGKVGAARGASGASQDGAKARAKTSRKQRAG